jgi:hypothetical protein
MEQQLLIKQKAFSFSNYFFLIIVVRGVKLKGDAV